MHDDASNTRSGQSGEENLNEENLNEENLNEENLTVQSGVEAKVQSEVQSEIKSNGKDERLVLLETKVAYQERTIQQLNDQMYQQQKQIDRLERIVIDLSNRVKAALTDFEVDETTGVNNQSLDADVPPHY